MADERVVKTETDWLGREHQTVYEGGKKVGEIRSEERRGLFEPSATRVSVEYDNDGRKISTSRVEKERGLFDFLGGEVEVKYDPSGNKISTSRPEEVGGIGGFLTHHEKIERDNDQNKISSTHFENRGSFFGVGQEKVRVTNYPESNENYAESREKYGDSEASSGDRVAISPSRRFDSWSEKSSGPIVLSILTILSYALYCYWVFKTYGEWGGAWKIDSLSDLMLIVLAMPGILAAGVGALVLLVIVVAIEAVFGVSL